MIKDFKFASTHRLDNSKRVVVFDIEANNLLHDVTKLWCLVAQDYKTREFYVFTDQPCEIVPVNGSMLDGVKFLVECRATICHNYANYDYFVLNKFYPHIFNKSTVPWSTCHDTYIQSKSQWFDRPKRKGFKGNHGLAYYGDVLGYPKPPIEDWTFWDDNKMERCVVDVMINTLTLDYLNKEKKERLAMGIDFSWQTNIAKYTQFWCTKQEINGIKANKPLLKQHFETLNKRIRELQSIIEPELPKTLRVKESKMTWEEVRDCYKGFYKKVPATQYEKVKKKGEVVDAPIKPAYKPCTNYREKVVKTYWKATSLVDGTTYSYRLKNEVKNHIKQMGLNQKDFSYEKVIEESFLLNSYTCEWFGVKPQDTHIISGPFTRIYYEDTKLTQHAEVKKFLLSLGWIPTEHNLKKDVYGRFIKNPDGSYVKGSPKLTEDSFESLPEGIGQQIAEYNTLMHRKRTIFNEKKEDKGWLNNLDDNDRLRAGANVFATSTGRHTQSNFVNCPSASASFGAEMREPWTAEVGSKLVSTDMDSAQLVLLAGFMNDYAFTEAVKNGDEVVEFDEKPDKYFEITDDGKYRVYYGTDAHTLNSIYFGLNDESDVVSARETQNSDLIHKIANGRKKAKNGIYCLLLNVAA